MSTPRQIAEKMIKDGEAMIADAKSKLAEIDKPIPKKGDYGLCYQGKRGWVVLDATDQDKVKAMVDGDEDEEWGSGFHKATRLGNIFDDIANKGKTLEKFNEAYGAVSLGAKYDMDGISVTHRSGDSYSWVTTDEAQDFCDKLQQVIRFARAKK